MKTFTIHVNQTLDNLLSLGHSDSGITHRVPDRPQTSKELTLALASSLQDLGFKVGVELKLPGIQRPKRIPLAAIANNKILILKICTDDIKLEPAVLLMADLLKVVRQELSSEFQVLAGVAYDGPTLDRIDKLARDLEVSIVNQSQVHGLLD